MTRKWARNGLHAAVGALATLLLVLWPAGPARAVEPAAGMFLVADPQMRDPNFEKTVVLIVFHGPQGTHGIVINRPSDMRVGRMVPKLAPNAEAAGWLYFGGPVNRHMVVSLVRSQDAVSNSVRVFGDVHASHHPDTLREWSGRNGEQTVFRAYAGYAGWAPGQLAAEIARGGWRVVPADAGLLFDVPATEIWNQLTGRGGRWVGPDPQTIWSTDSSLFRVVSALN